MFSYENAKIYKEKIKQLHDKHIQQRSLIPGQLVLLYNSRLKLFLGKLKSRWLGPSKLVRIYNHGVVDLLYDRIDQEFKVNGHKVKHYMDSTVDHSKEDVLLKNPTL